jgi:hypothetical protein
MAVRLGLSLEGMNTGKGFQASAAMLIRSALFWDIMPRRAQVLLAKDI